MAKQRMAGAIAMSLFAETGNLLRELFKALFDSYRPELHYMRGPGPKVRQRNSR